MAQHSVSLDVASALAPPRICAACGSNLHPISDAEGVSFTCLHCQRGWVLELGVLVPADPDRFPAYREEAADALPVPKQRRSP